MDIEVVVYKIKGNFLEGSIRKVVFEQSSLEDGRIKLDFSSVGVCVDCDDPNLLKLIQIKSIHAIVVHKRFDVVEYLSRWLSLKEIQGLKVYTYAIGDKDFSDISHLVMLEALREEPNKPKHLREPEPPKEPVAQKSRVHKVFRPR